MTTTPNTITEKQLAFITRLLDERDTGFNAEATQTVKDHLPEMSKQSASDLITALLAKPEIAKAPATNDTRAGKEDNYGIPSDDVLPTGRYAIDTSEGDLAFYRVWRGTRNPDYVKVYLLHGPDESEIPFSKGMVTILKSIAEDAPAAAIRYGHEIGACSVCAKRLTNRVSRALGIGPICGGHFYGEEFKSVVHGAREQIKAQGLDPDSNVEEDEVVERYDVRADFEAPAEREGGDKWEIEEEMLDNVAPIKRDVEGLIRMSDILHDLESRSDAELTSIMTVAATILERRSQDLMAR